MLVLCLMTLAKIIFFEDLSLADADVKKVRQNSLYITPGRKLLLLLSVCVVVRCVVCVCGSSIFVAEQAPFLPSL